MDERELIRQAQAGDLQAFEQLVKGWREQVFRVARQIVGEEEGAKDVAQLVFIRLWQVLRKYRDRKIDLADACLIRLADEFETPDILTLDRDFAVYRWSKNKPFCILPGL